jgi:hypothetical protein
MPAASKKQEKFMRAVAHSPSFAKKVGVPVSVGKEFTKSEGGMANTSRMNRLEELGRVNAEKAKTAKGKKNLAAEKKRIIGEMKEAGMKKMASGGLAAGHKAADGIAKKGKTKGKEVKMALGGFAGKIARNMVAPRSTPQARSQSQMQAVAKQQALMQKSAPPRGPVKQANPFGMGMSQDTSALNKIGQAKQQAPAYAQPYANKMTSMVKAAGGAQEQQLAAQRAQYDKQSALRGQAAAQKQKAGMMGQGPQTAKKMASGGLAAGHKQADGIAKKGKTRAMQVKMAGGGKTKKYC